MRHDRPLPAVPAPDSASVVDCLCNWVQPHVTPDAFAWLASQIETLRDRSRDSTSTATLNMAVSIATRKLGKFDLPADGDMLREAARLRPGWTPRGWTTGQAGRIACILAAGDHPDFAAQLEMLFRTADVAESISLYQALPLYPNPTSLTTRAAEGTRTNIMTVFEAIAHENPFPAEHFDTMQWNQMVLKAVFVGSKLDPIQGLDERANASLTTMLCRYAGERRAASRVMTPELWRPIGLAPTPESVDVLAPLLRSSDAWDVAAGRLALQDTVEVARRASEDQRPAMDAIAEAAEQALDAADPDPLAVPSRSAVPHGAITWEQIARSPNA